jgi:hypothetical protein
VTRRIAVVGAPGTGKTTLCLELSAQVPGVVIVDATAETVAMQDCAATLLAGLDIGPMDIRREQEDQRIRAQLQGAGIAFQVVYGTGEERLRSALRALRADGVLPSGIGESESGQERQRPWTWVCEKCSDPACEHRLFTQLQDARRGS